MKVLINITMVRSTLRYGCETTRTENLMRMGRWTLGDSLLEHRRNEEMLQEARVGLIVTVKR